MVVATVLSQVSIGGADRSSDVLRVETNRGLNGIGSWNVVLRNIGDKYRGIFDVQDEFLLDVNGLGNTLMQGRVDWDAVNRIGKDLESYWDEYVVIRGVDQAQDLLFHNDFDHYYPDSFTPTQTLNHVVNEVINTHLAITNPTNITYMNRIPDTTPRIGSVEFREGTSFLSTFQEMFKTAEWLFYVDDVLALQMGAAAAGINASGVTLQSVAGSINNNIIGGVEVKERDGGKLYNYVKLYGKNPMFDAYTEYNAYQTGPPLVLGWEPDSFIGVTDSVLDDDDTTIVGEWSVVACNANPAVSLIGVELNTQHPLLVPPLTSIFNYESWDFTKGDLGTWCYYDNDAGAPGTPGAGAAAVDGYLFIIITDSAGLQAGYYGTSTRIYEDEWTWCSVTLGEGERNWVGWVPDKWYFLGAGDFLWDEVVSINLIGTDILQPWIGNPSHLYIDGFTMPEAAKGVAEDATAQTNYRRRPYVENFQNIRTHNALQGQADRLLAQHKSTTIDEIRLVTVGNQALRYAGQSVTIYVPGLGLVNPVDPNTGIVCYMSEINHIIEPYNDVSGGYGFDWITEVKAIPVDSVMYDYGRLSPSSTYSAMQVGSRASAGIRMK